MNKKEKYININELSRWVLISLRKKWELSKMGITLYEEPAENEGTYAEDQYSDEIVRQWIDELEYYLDENASMEIVGDLIETVSEYFERSIGESRSNDVAYDFIKGYLSRVEANIFDVEQDPFGPGDPEKRSMLKKKQFENSESGKQEIQLLKNFPKYVEIFLEDMPSETKNTFDIRDDQEGNFSDLEDNGQYWPIDEAESA